MSKNRAWSSRFTALSFSLPLWLYTLKFGFPKLHVENSEFLCLRNCDSPKKKNPVVFNIEVKWCTVRSSCAKSLVKYSVANNPHKKSTWRRKNGSLRTYVLYIVSKSHSKLPNSIRWSGVFVSGTGSHVEIKDEARPDQETLNRGYGVQFHVVSEEILTPCAPVFVRWLSLPPHDFSSWMAFRWLRTKRKS